MKREDMKKPVGGSDGLEGLGLEGRCYAIQLISRTRTCSPDPSGRGDARGGDGDCT